MVARTTPGTHTPRISTQTVTKRSREIGERPHIQCVLYAAFLFWPSIYVEKQSIWAELSHIMQQQVIFLIVGSLQAHHSQVCP